MCDFLVGLDMHGFACWCMVLTGCDIGFQPSLAFFSMPWCWDVYFGFELWLFGWISESKVEVVSRFIPKGLGVPWLFLDWLLYVIPHSCLEYGMDVTG